METSIDQKISDTTQQISDSQKKLVSLNELLASCKLSLSGWYAYVPTSDAGGAERTTNINRYKADISKYEGLLSAESNNLNILKSVLVGLQEQKKVEVATSEANIQTIEAAAKLTASQANLTPEQLFQLQLSKIQTDSETQKSKSAISQAAIDKAAENKKYYIIGGIVFVVIALGTFLYFKFKTKKTN